MCQICTCFNMIKVTRDREAGQAKAAHVEHVRSDQSHIGQSIMARNLHPGTKCVLGVIEQKLGPEALLLENKM